VRKEVEVMRHPRYRECSAHKSVMRYNLCYGEMFVRAGCVEDCFYLQCDEYCTVLGCFCLRSGGVCSKGRIRQHKYAVN
jgi:hypothetical protein